MDILTITHSDFVLSIECSKFDAIWNKAKNNIGEENLTSTYSWSQGVVSVKRNDIIIVPVGTTEMHGGLPLDCETVLSEAIALKMAEAEANK